MAGFILRSLSVEACVPINAVCRLFDGSETDSLSAYYNS